jgi:hypothetical protein
MKGGWDGGGDFGTKIFIIFAFLKKRKKKKKKKKKKKNKKKRILGPPPHGAGAARDTEHRAGPRLLPLRFTLPREHVIGLRDARKHLEHRAHRALRRARQLAGEEFQHDLFSLGVIFENGRKRNEKKIKWIE